MSTKIELPQVKAFQTCICKLICRSLVNITLSFCVKYKIAEHLPRTQRKTSKETSNLHSPTPTPLLIFDRRPPPWFRFFFSHSLPLPLKSKMAAIVFVEKKKLVSKKILSTRSPILRLLCKLNWPVCCKQESETYHKIQWFKVFIRYFFDKNTLLHGHINVLVDTLTIWQT